MEIIFAIACGILSFIVMAFGLLVFAAMTSKDVLDLLFDKLTDEQQEEVLEMMRRFREQNKKARK